MLRPSQNPSRSKDFSFLVEFKKPTVEDQKKEFFAKHPTWKDMLILGELTQETQKKILERCDMVGLNKTLQHEQATIANLQWQLKENVFKQTSFDKQITPQKTDLLALLAIADIQTEMEKLCTVITNTTSNGRDSSDGLKNDQTNIPGNPGDGDGRNRYKNGKERHSRKKVTRYIGWTSMAIASLLAVGQKVISYIQTESQKKAEEMSLVWGKFDKDMADSKTIPPKPLYQPDPKFWTTTFKQRTEAESRSKNQEPVKPEAISPQIVAKTIDTVIEKTNPDPVQAFLDTALQKVQSLSQAKQISNTTKTLLEKEIKAMPTYASIKMDLQKNLKTIKKTGDLSQTLLAQNIESLLQATQEETPTVTLHAYGGKGLEAMTFLLLQLRGQDKKTIGTHIASLLAQTKEKNPDKFAGSIHQIQAGTALVFDLDEAEKIINTNQIVAEMKQSSANKTYAKPSQTNQIETSAKGSQGSFVEQKSDGLNKVISSTKASPLPAFKKTNKPPILADEKQTAKNLLKKTTQDHPDLPPLNPLPPEQKLDHPYSLGNNPAVLPVKKEAHFDFENDSKAALKNQLFYLAIHEKLQRDKKQTGFLKKLFTRQKNIIIKATEFTDKIEAYSQLASQLTENLDQTYRQEVINFFENPKNSATIDHLLTHYRDINKNISLPRQDIYSLLRNKVLPAIYQSELVQNEDLKLPAKSDKATNTSESKSNSENNQSSWLNSTDLTKQFAAKKSGFILPAGLNPNTCSRYLDTVFQFNYSDERLFRLRIENPAEYRLAIQAKIHFRQWLKDIPATTQIIIPDHLKKFVRYVPLNYDEGVKMGIV